MFSSRFSRIVLSLFVLASSIWLGLAVARLAVGYDAFVAGTVTLKQKLSQPVLLQTIWLYTSLGMWTTIAYATAAATGLLVLWLVRQSFRTHGWVLMSAILFVILIPAQAYLIDADLLLWSFFDYHTGMPLAQPGQIINVFTSRFSNQAIGITTSLVLLSGITIVLFTTMRPLHNTATNE
jgi:hypothetical protein